ncbi:bifunctional diguanylate cyclase/phosphodiesterase [Phaeobacter inhibens]|uniref:bifunctional diguanylate cyclase/phosphodiesterase n=1 Tax=Phaeobacter inhibens TaxID=221822 RepID=UPI000C99845D|nr:EAL domain-containing protein [Phaeobacter inhibens]AUQ52810.1 putative signaling protein with diguanylate cyclase/phosphodiesterase activity [Phaeobacter inhibens]AUQ76825.1 putative signaling protein with diguanylate cyclase/phosphodiesterase activity [Phaeobacter inhibens]AUR13986.1 putative signaling protein with diguanylate cyclase/phosphodiesterase activity [Phaeobacter inhibens]
MYSVVQCITQEHSLGLVAVAALVCVIGSCLSVLMTQRLGRTAGTRKLVQLALTSLISGGTVWTTHFIAMLAFDPGYAHGYDPLLTGVSLAAAVVGMLMTNGVYAFAHSTNYRVAASGAMFGLSVSTMHYLGMSGYLLPGEIVWQTTPLISSILLGAVLGVATYEYLTRYVTGRHWIVAVVLMTLTICTMHFTGMSAITVQLSPLYSVPPEVISDATLGLFVLGTMAIILMIGFAALSIETNMESEARNQLQHAALHDPLTGLPNRMALTRKMASLTELLERDETERVAVLTLDLNLFKEINDLYGHSAGDSVLTTVANRLNSVLEKDEFIARVGGDEFVALKQGFRRVDQVLAFAERLHALTVEPVDFDNTSAIIGVAIGVATSLEDGRDIRDLLHKSDVAMYRAKADADRHIYLFNAQMEKHNRARLELVSDLRQACIAGDQFELAYQLQNDLSSLAPVGFEVLLRWNHPTKGRVSPDTFIPIAEETGLIREIGLWVLRTACQEASSWPGDFNIAVNVAPQQLMQPSFVEHVSDILLETGLPAERLELEITEASIIDDQVHTLKVMQQLKTMGLRIAMDDFGTGYSSLAMLQTFPFDKIKIDQSFVQNVHIDAQRAAIVRSTLLLGAALNIPVLAEGVEVEDELQFLRMENCSSVQGFYFGKPMTRDEMREVVQANQPKKKTA